MDAFLPTFLQQFEHLKIKLEDITSATNNFHHENCIGGGGFGKVYKGELCHHKGRSMVAIKRLDSRNGQGTPEFLKEITTLHRYSHENLIALLGFCCEGNEMILVYEHASRGSLDRHLNSPLAWTQRLKVCLDAAKGLTYLHDPRETHQRLIHCDVKSANILLNEQWNAKVSDFGLSIMGSANDQHSVIINFAAGTLGYCDPEYAWTHTLTKESDVYSFGVVLFEILCGRLCYTLDSNNHVKQVLVPTWIESYEQNKLNDHIYKNPNIQPLEQASLETFSEIAYRCLKESREDRPKMAEVVTQLEVALEIQEFSEANPLFCYEEMVKTAEPPLIYRSKLELWKLLNKGVLLNKGNTWFILNEKGEHCEMISSKSLNLPPAKSGWPSFDISRFPGGPTDVGNRISTVWVKTQFLSPGVTYTANLVFNARKERMSTRRIDKKDRNIYDPIFLKYKIEGETKTSISYLAYQREDGWWMCELYQFTCYNRTIYHEIVFEGFHKAMNTISVEGIEFRPLEEVKHKDKEPPISYSDANWEEKLPNDYEDILKWSKHSMPWTTKKEVYLIICKGFLIDDGEKWFSIDQNGKKCHMVSSRAAGISNKPQLSLPESRFGEAFQCNSYSHHLDINYTIQPQLLSSETTYASYLVYKLAKSPIEPPMRVEHQEHLGLEFIYLVAPQTPVMKPNADQSTRNPLSAPKIKGFPRERNDGWMEVQIWEFRTSTTTKINPMSMRLYLTNYSDKEVTLDGLIIEGVEFRPT